MPSFLSVRRIAPTVSTVYRLLAYIFLRVIPFRLGTFVLPALYTFHLLLNILTFGSSRARSKENGASIKVPALAQSLLFSLHTRSRQLRIINLAFNTILLLFVADFVLLPAYHPAEDLVFARVGAVLSDSVKVHIRYPHPDANDGSVSVKYRPAYRSEDEAAWQDGPVVHLKEVDDWVGSVSLSSLWPNTTYEYILANSSHALPYPSSPLIFKTFPDHRLHSGSFFRFVTSSCLKHNFPYVPGAANQIKGFELLSHHLWPEGGSAQSKVSNATTFENAAGASIAEAPPGSSSDLDVSSTEFLLLLGDFIYADVPYYFGADEEMYKRMYRHTYASPSFRKIYERLPVFHIYDDHEIMNNFEGGSSETALYENAARAFHLYNANGNYNSTESDEYYYNFRHGEAAFFVTDTRRHRSKTSATEAHDRTMLGERQLSALYSWLGEVNETAVFKFVVSSVPFTSLWQHDAQTDSWAAYPDEKASLLKVFHSVPNVVILSGDRHEFAAIEYNGPYEWSYRVLEFSTSPLSMFYVPFVRTLKMESADFVEKVSVRMTEGTSVKEVDLVASERVLEYKPTGNYKWSTFEVDTRNSTNPLLNLELTVDGTSSYRTTINGTQVSLRRSTALGVLIPQTMHDILDKIGFTPSKWF